MVSQLTSVVKNTDDIHFLSIDSAPAVLSVDVARNFQRQHSHVLREIDRLRSILPKSFNASNFGRVDIPDAKGEKRRAYLLTRDALSLLVMGFTGKAAIMWKLRYIEAFNTMEQALYENIRREARAGGAEAVKAACQQARTETAQLFWRLGPVQKRRVRQAVRYHAMGLGKHSIAKLLDVDGREVSRLLKAARALGWLGEKASERPALPVQGNLLALAVATKEATDKDSNSLHGKAASEGAIAIRKPARRANGYREVCNG